MDIAARLLADAVQTGRSVTDIAYAVGFKDASHFARAFKSRHCVSPREYRRDHSAAPQGPGA
ncbi:helix-turn-helix domain-containing protein [Streptomyces ossamyceticus]|uniref:helix-turn-helix domain-containing protein n=1 Tax=Streptomyces ossamyceticus TaxID=249581 RepID=UPI00343AC78A